MFTFVDVFKNYYYCYWDTDYSRLDVVVALVAWSIDRDIEWMGVDDGCWLEGTTDFILIASSYGGGISERINSR
jgi:hypothetical protein